jgi:solute carrier family 25 uncoupling protein 27
MDHKYIQNKYKKLFLIQTSACIAETSTYPIDYIKTLIQVNKSKQSFRSALWDLSLSNNKLQVYNGLKPALLRHCTYTMLRINFYENNRGVNDNDILRKFVVGGLSGGLSQFIASPFDLLKIRYITDMKENNKKTNNISLLNTTKSIYNERGIKGLWKGVTPNVSRSILVNFGELATYDIAKQKIKKTLGLKEGTPLHVTSSICSGFVSSLFCTPADVIKSRMMQVNSPYSGIIHCIGSSVRQEGVLSLYKGFFPIWLRLAPWQLIFWVSYERLRIYSGIESF